MSTMLSPHFADYELKCRCARHRKEPYCYVSPRLLSLAEAVRDVLGTPMIPTSCCRCVAHNADVGGVENSYHIGTPSQGARAMDFKPKNLTQLDAYNAIVKAWTKNLLTALGGIGIYKTFIHIDTGTTSDGHLRTWDERDTGVKMVRISPRLQIPADIAEIYRWSRGA